MKKLILAAAIVAGATASASAADMRMPTKAPLLAPAPIFSWNGFYVGAHLGGAWARQDSAGLPSVTTDQGPSAFDLDKNGWIGGVHAGFNFTMAPNWLLGIEADISATDLDASAGAPNTDFAGAILASGGLTSSRSLDWLATLRLRAGVLIAPTWLAYLTGGVAFADVNYSGLNAFVGGCPNCALFDVSNTDTGWTLGGGIETALWGRWLARVEYLYYHFDGDAQTSALVGFPALNATMTWGDLDIHTLRAGLSYKF